MINLYFKGDICDYVDPIDLEVEPDIKRKIRADVIDVPVSLIMSPEDGNMIGVETFGGKPSGNVFSTDREVRASLNLLQRIEGGEEEDCGTLLVLPGLRSMPTLGMSSGARDMAVNIMIAILQVQQWLEKEGILDKNPEKDSDSLRILMDVIDEKPVVKILTDEEVILTTEWE